MATVFYRSENSSANGSWMVLSQSGSVWSAPFNSSGITDGNYTIRINATDTAGNSNTTQTIAVSYDTVTPSIVFNLPLNNQTRNTASSDFSVNVSDENVNNVTFYSDNILNETNSSGKNGSYTFTKTFADGTHSWSVTVIDRAGQSNQTGSRNVTIDTVYPSVSISTSSGQKTSRFPINATVTDSGSIATVFYRSESPLGNSDWMVLSNSSSVWSAPFNSSGVTDGNYTIRINATDTAGNSNTTQTIAVTYDTNAPSISSPVASATNGSAGTVFSFNVSISDESTDVNVTTMFVTIAKNSTVLAVPLTKSGAVYTASWNSSGRPNGSYAVSFEANDSVGNRRTMNKRFLLAVSNSSRGSYQNESYSLTGNTLTHFNNSLNSSNTILVSMLPARDISNASFSFVTYSTNQEGSVRTERFLSENSSTSLLIMIRTRIFRTRSSTCRIPLRSNRCRNFGIIVESV